MPQVRVSNKNVTLSIFPERKTAESIVKNASLAAGTPPEIRAPHIYRRPCTERSAIGKKKGKKYRSENIVDRRVNE